MPDRSDISSEAAQVRLRADVLEENRPDDARGSARKTETFSLAHTASRQIADMVRTGVLRPGQRLPSERELAVALELSRGALREALRTLESVGIVTARAGSGRYVTSSNVTDPGGGLGMWMQFQPSQDVVAVRRVLEPAAIVSIPATQLHEITAETRRLLRRMQQAFARGAHEAAAQIHTEFHLALVQHGQPRLLRLLLASMIRAVEGTQLEIFRTPGAGRHSLLSHDPIVEALEAGDVLGAAQGDVDHLVPAFTYLSDDALAQGSNL
ncbi:MAG: FadR family transcriptional regulator [Actinobacteria bacterium]|nr:FadR family transcriptional regulator [Actinomycetota bacterium]